MQLQNRTFISEIALPYVCIFSKFFGEFPRKIFTFPQKYDRINREQQNQTQWGSMLTEQEGSSNMVYVTGDLHGDYSRFKRPEMKKLRAGDILLGFWVYLGQLQTRASCAEKAQRKEIYHCFCGWLSRKL